MYTILQIDNAYWVMRDDWKIDGPFDTRKAAQWVVDDLENWEMMPEGFWVS